MSKSVTQFKPGVSGNPLGRPVGSRNRISEQFLLDLRDTWSRHGMQVLEKVATEQPAKLLAAMIQLMPKDVLLNIKDHRSVIEYSTQELLEIIAAGSE